VDALEELDRRAPVGLRAGKATFTGDGATTSFKIEHGLAATPTAALAGKGTSGIPDIDYWTADTTHITVVFKVAPPSGVSFDVWWLALRL